MPKSDPLASAIDRLTAEIKRRTDLQFPTGKVRGEVEFGKAEYGERAEEKREAEALEASFSGR